jgi:ADP-ribose pyrophosphatase YjhB (NUDIX family)
MTIFEYAIVDVLVERDGKFLIVREGKKGRENMWNLPGGHVDNLETIAEAAIRETQEETGYKIELTGFLGIYQALYQAKDLNVAGPVFLGKVVDGEATTSSKHPEIKWVTAEELIVMANRGEFWTKYPPLLVKDYQRRGAYPLELVSSCRY